MRSRLSSGLPIVVPYQAGITPSLLRLKIRIPGLPTLGKPPTGFEFSVRTAISLFLSELRLVLSLHRLGSAPVALTT